MREGFYCNLIVWKMEIMNVEFTTTTKSESSLMETIPRKKRKIQTIDSIMKTLEQLLCSRH